MHIRDTARSQCSSLMKNIRPLSLTYQRLVNAMFKDLIGKTIELYVDDMLVKSRITKDHMDHLGYMFSIFRKYQMKLNPLKCAFKVGSRKFLGLRVS